ncbi:hypothetical protein J2W56_001011 [Nocardia kruczakiae]|uniref:Uncharacterized protein n=1 Tax=Nocardia kruczakiae TaxID=261477 RepID=A0ABU1X9T3_9NOCA|nr:hypothetical protein [Nocardia kruczakiae]MDR7167293.1 hypothetical protein [Nocardia kruczakiae]
MPEPIYTDVHEVLDYFGKCAHCDYPASASLVIRWYSDYTSDRELIATCGLPCGWQESVPMKKMTGSQRITNTIGKTGTPHFPGRHP